MLRYESQQLKQQGLKYTNVLLEVTSSFPIVLSYLFGPLFSPHHGGMSGPGKFTGINPSYLPAFFLLNPRFVNGGHHVVDLTTNSSFAVHFYLVQLGFNFQVLED